MKGIPAGYKQTEVGVFPEDWEILDLESITDPKRSISYGIVQTGPNIQNGIRCLRVVDIEDGKINSGDMITTSKTISDSYKRTILKAEDLVMPLRGKVGDIAIVNDELAGCNLTRGVALIAVRPDWSARYCRQYISSLSTRNRLEQSMNGSALQEIPIASLRSFKIALPPTKAEQEAIAEALNDTDALIESLEQLIAKKRHLKQGAMQELLTGKKRLPGFSGEWEIVPLGSLINSLDSGVSVNSVEKGKDIFAHDESILKTSCVIGGKFLPEEHKQILPSDIHRAKLNPRKDSIIFSRMNTPALVGECGYVDRDYPILFIPDRLWMARFGGPYPTCARWLAYLLSFGSFNQAIKETATGTSGSMKNISQGSLLSVHITLPTKSEQTAIATILSDMDAEITALETKLAKTRQLKQGMMHNLLTGRIRLL